MHIYQVIPYLTGLIQYFNAISFHRTQITTQLYTNRLIHAIDVMPSSPPQPIAAQLVTLLDRPVVRDLFEVHGEVSLDDGTVVHLF